MRQYRFLLLAGAALAVLLLGLLIAFALLQGGPVTQERYDAATADLETMIRLTGDGDLAGGEEAFWRAHPFLHDVDPPLRRTDPELAQQLWDAVARVEIAYASDPAREDLLRLGGEVITLLQRAAPALGLEP